MCMYDRISFTADPIYFSYMSQQPRKMIAIMCLQIKENYVHRCHFIINQRLRPQHLGALYLMNMEGQINSLKPYLPRLFIKIKQPKTISRPISSFTVKEDHIGSAVSKILRYRQKSILLYILGQVILPCLRLKYTNYLACKSCRGTSHLKK